MSVLNELCSFDIDELMDGFNDIVTKLISQMYKFLDGDLLPLDAVKMALTLIDIIDELKFKIEELTLKSFVCVILKKMNIDEKFENVEKSIEKIIEELDVTFDSLDKIQKNDLS